MIQKKWKRNENIKKKKNGKGNIIHCKKCAIQTEGGADPKERGYNALEVALFKYQKSYDNEKKHDILKCIMRHCLLYTV